MSTLVIQSDLEIFQQPWNKKISTGSCAQDFFEIKAKDPNTISIVTTPLAGNTSNEVQELKDEIVKLKEEVAKKDAVLMEQLRVIMDLANKLTSTVYEKFVSLFSF